MSTKAGAFPPPPPPPLRVMLLVKCRSYQDDGKIQHHNPGSVQSSGKPRVSSAAPPPGNGLCVHSRGLMLKGLTGRQVCTPCTLIRVHGTRQALPGSALCPGES
eukprot:scaffold188476_cov24-Tisochrysis_lutea.AAC.1